MNILIKLWTKSSILFKLVLFLFILYILNEIYKASSNKKEGFNNKILNSSYKIYSGDEVYNKFYAGVYDNIMHNNDRMKLETKTILKYPITYGKLLDIGSGTGHLVNLLKTNIDCLGVDNSKHMVLRSKFNYPKNKYIHTDVSDSMIFLPNQFTHITCLYYTIYYKFVFYVYIRSKICAYLR